MSDPEEDTYSIMFTSLRHTARRKILRMLSEKPRNFTEMLRQLGISSSHLTYHLENLGDLVSKMEDGRYKLSAFGEAAVATMSTVEELKGDQEPEPRRLLSPRKRLPTSWVVLMIGIVALASVCLMQYRVSSQLSSDYERLKAEHDVQYRFLNELSAEYGRLDAKYGILVEGRIPEPWDFTPENVARLKDIEQQAVPRLERLVKDEGIPICGVYIGMDQTGKWIKLFVIVRYICPEDKARVMDIFGWDVPVAFHGIDGINRVISGTIVPIANDRSIEGHAEGPNPMKHAQLSV